VHRAPGHRGRERCETVLRDVEALFERILGPIATTDHRQSDHRCHQDLAIRQRDEHREKDNLARRKSDTNAALVNGQIASLSDDQQQRQGDELGPVLGDVAVGRDGSREGGRQPKDE
jgi:hypothetical protein